MNSNVSPIVVAGHICLDIIPLFPENGEESQTRIEPGKLYLTGPAQFSTGGAVSNTGLALKQLGIPVRLMGKVAPDLFGEQILTLLREADPELAGGMVISPDDHTSYSIVISPPRVDRSFLHSPGANETFRVEEINLEMLEDASIFHFGYPPLMEHFYRDCGLQLKELFQRIRSGGTLTSIDMCMPDPNSGSGRYDWKEWLQNVLPVTDFFLPSLEEIMFMLGYSAEEAGEALNEEPDMSLLSEVADALMECGAKVVVLKLGDYGLYLRTGRKDSDLPLHAKIPLSRKWNHRELLAPCYSVEVAGTTGAGDCTIAGLLAAITEGDPPEEALRTAVGVGASSVEAADSTSGVPGLQNVRERIQNGWNRKTVHIDQTAWAFDVSSGNWIGPRDQLQR